MTELKLIHGKLIGETVSKGYLIVFKPLPNPPLKQIRGGNNSLLCKVLHPFPYCLREGDGGWVQKKKNYLFDYKQFL